MSSLESSRWLSIGEVAEATGLSPDVLRVWERRYGVPKPQRTPSGHRRYDAAELPRLREVAEALAQGLRPSGVLNVARFEGPPALPRAETLCEWDPVRWRQAWGLTQARLNLDGLRRIEQQLNALERAESLGALDPGEGAWIVEQVLDVLAEIPNPPSPWRVVVHASVIGGRFTEVRSGLVAAAFRLQHIPTLALRRPWPVQAFAAFAEEAGVSQVVVPLAFDGRTKACREGIRTLRAQLPERIEMWVCGPGRSRAPREKGIEAHCGVREHQA